MEVIISNILSIVGTYLAIGVIFSLVFLWKGIAKIDAGVNGSDRLFKVLIFPGLIVFWVYFLHKWLKTNAS